MTPLSGLLKPPGTCGAIREASAVHGSEDSKIQRTRMEEARPNRMRAVNVDPLELASVHIAESRHSPISLHLCTVEFCDNLGPNQYMSTNRDGASLLCN